MKINLILPHQLPFPPSRGGGVENLNWLLAQEMARQGHEVVAYSRLLSGLAMREQDDFGIRHVRLPGFDLHPNRWIDHGRGLRYALCLPKVLEPGDVSSFHTPFSFLLARSRKLGVVTHTLHRTPKWPLPLYRGLDRLYCGSDAVVQQALAIDAKAKNLKRIHNCVALSDAPPEPARPIPGDGLTFLYVGRFVPDKGIASLIYGFEIALRSHPNLRLETIGPQKSAEGASSRFFDEMSRYVKKNGLGDRVLFHPPEFNRALLGRRMAAADVVCVPSLSGETFSMAILEAMAMAKPVLVSDFSPMPEAVDHRVTGYVARADDRVTLAEGIKFFAENPSQLLSIGRAGWQKAKSFFSVERIAGEYLEDFRRLAEERKTKCGAAPIRSAPIGTYGAK